MSIKSLNEGFIKAYCEGYQLLSGTDVKMFRDYDVAKKVAHNLGLKEAEYGDAYGVSYCMWNKSGNRNDDEEVIAYYTFANGEPFPLSDDDADRIEHIVEATFDNSDRYMEESCKKKLKESILVQMDEDDLLYMLMDRLEQWNSSGDRTISNLYEDMYRNMIDNGVFDGQKINIQEIVDNDWVNYCDVIGPGDEDYDAVKQLADEGEYDISSDTIYSYIEASADENGTTFFLVRH